MEWVIIKDKQEVEELSLEAYEKRIADFQKG